METNNTLKMQKTDRQIQMFFQKKEDPIFTVRKIKTNFQIPDFNFRITQIEKLDQSQREILINGNWEFYQTTLDEDFAIWLSDPKNLKKFLGYFLFAAVSVSAVGYHHENIILVLIVGFILLFRSFLIKKPPVS